MTSASLCLSVVHESLSAYGRIALILMKSLNTLTMCFIHRGQK